MSAPEPEAADIADALTDAVRQFGPRDGIVVAWVAVCEVLEGASGDLSLITLSDDTAPYWRHRGMLTHAAVPSEADYPDDDD